MAKKKAAKKAVAAKKKTAKRSSTTKKGSRKSSAKAPRRAAAKSARKAAGKTARKAAAKSTPRKPAARKAAPKAARKAAPKAAARPKASQQEAAPSPASEPVAPTGEMERSSPEVVETTSAGIQPLAPEHAAVDDLTSSGNELLDIFQKYDRNRTGYIEQAEFARLLEALGQNITDEELMIAFDIIDTERTGKISWKQFKNWWTSR